MLSLSLCLPAILMLQAGSTHAILEAEYRRPADISVITSGLKSSDSAVVRTALRAIGRLERPALQDAVAPFVRSRDPEIRREAVAALAQMSAPFAFATLLPDESSGAVRAVIYEAMGRFRPWSLAAETSLVSGLGDVELEARRGAARGLETLIRTNVKTTKPQPATLIALRQAVRDNADPVLRQFALLSLNAALDRDESILDLALRDEDPQVRRLAVSGLKRFVDDPSPIVRYESLRVAASCERAAASVSDPSGHVALAAVDALGTLKCDAALVVPLVDKGASWRVRSRALVALAKIAPDLARTKLASFRADPQWQVRAYTANAAKIVNDTVTLDLLAADPNPSVAQAAIFTASHALRALDRDHSGLLVTAAQKLKGSPEAKSAAGRIAATVLRLSKGDRVTVRDPRMRLIELLLETQDRAALDSLRPLLADRDPEVAALVARSLTEVTGEAIAPRTKEYTPPPFPSEETLRSLAGARAIVTLRGLGSVTLLLLPEEAPATVATFAALAGRGAYDGLSFHRVVPNFVLQGGSPGADEYEALTSEFMRDELGFASNRRGTLGISTRGHDTGDGQIFVNLIDNWRLDHTYTVFARVTEGMDIVDRILEGDVIDRIRIERAPR